MGNAKTTGSIGAFTDLLGKLVQVPKKEVERAEKAWKKKRAKLREKKRGT